MRKQLEIFGTVVRLYSVQMMNIFVLSKAPPDLLLYDVPMLFHAAL